MDAILADLRQARRALLRHPGLALTAWLTLAIGIGATTAIFSVVYGVLLRPLPYDDADRLVRLSESHPGATSPLRGALLSNRTYFTWTQAPTTVEAVAPYSPSKYTARIGNETLRLGGAAVSPALFATLRVAPAMGRFFTADEAASQVPVAIISQGLWQTRFGSRPNALGSTITIDGRAHTIVGVSPAGFDFPSNEASLWTPYRVAPVTSADANAVSVFFAIARLRGNATPQQAAAEGTAAARALPRPMVTELLFGKGGAVQVAVRPIVDQLTTNVRPALLVLMAGVGLVLAIACANVANLLLSRGVDRQRELAVRVALGADGRQIARHLLVESLLLSGLGGLAGIALAWLLIRLLPTLAPASFPRLDAIQVDARVLVFAVAASLLAGLVAGLFPAWRSAQAALGHAIREGDQRTSTAGGRSRRVLLAAEAALAVVLLIGAALLGRSFVNIVGTPTGFDATNVLMARVYPTEREQSPAATQQLIDHLVSRIRVLPGVIEVGASNMAPFGSAMYVSGFMLPTGSPDGGSILARGLEHVVTPGYLRALDVSLSQGRLLTDDDARARIRAMIVNERFAREHFKDGRPVLGRQWTNKDGEMTQIVGVIGDVKRDGPLSTAEPEIYVSARQAETIRREVYLLIRTAGDPLQIAPALRPILSELDPTAALDDVGTLEGGLRASISEPRFVMATLMSFAAVALTLAAIGLYGSLSYAVAQRRREMGVRAALGATRGRLVGLVMNQGLRATVVGLGIGLAASAAFSNVMSRLLFGVTPLDFSSFVGAPLVLLAVASIACFVPARRAAATDPAEALRAE